MIYELGLEVDVDILNHQSYDALEWVINFKNTGGSKTHNLSKILGLDSTVPFVESDEVFFESLNGDQCDSESFMPIKRKIAIGEEMIVAPKGGRSSDFAFPFFDINTKEKGLILAIGWTGQWNLRLARDKDGLKVEVGFANDDFYLNPGESARSMRILVMGWEGDYLDAHNKFRRFMIEKNSPKAKLGGELSLPAAIQTFDLYSYVEKHAEIANFYNSEAGQLEILKRSLKCGGIDAFWVDASWFINHFPYGVGNYTFKEGFPNGLRPVFDEAHKQGMKTVMWFEPERVAQDTEMCRLHPEWLIEVAPEQGGLWGNNNNQQRLFNLAIPEAREFLTEFISNFIVEQGVDIYRQDFNMEIKNFWDANDEVGRSGLTEIKYIEGFYRFWDDLNARFPHLLIDNCSSGGRRIDLETCKRSVNLWRSDTGCYPMSDEMNTDIWNQNQVLGISKYTPYHSTAVWSLNTYEFRSAMTAGIALTFDLFSEDFNYSKASKLMEEFQNQKKYWEGDFYPLTEASLDETIWAAFQFNLKEEDKGMILIFRRKNNLLSSGNYRLRGLNPDKMYEVRIKDDDLNVVNKRASGKELMSGFEFGILSQRASLFVEYF
ncbi:MAG: alpha-galactosidase [Bacillota bacterium]